MNTLYTKIYESIDTGLQKVLVFDDDSSVNYGKLSLANGIDVPYEYRFIDMGTDVLWAEYNIGAFPGNKSEDWYGGYYAWGETETKSNYSWNHYIHYNNRRYLLKYNNDPKCGIVDDLYQLDATDDVVSMTLGGQYRMPTRKDFHDLLNNTKYKWVQNYQHIEGLDGLIFTADNGNVLFFPAADYYEGSNLVNDCDCINMWTSELGQRDSDTAYRFYFNSQSQTPIYDIAVYRYFGHSVRGVQDRNNIKI